MSRMCFISSHERVTERVLSWGHRELNDAEQAREHYLLALREADRGKFGRLVDFAKSLRDMGAGERSKPTITT